MMATENNDGIALTSAAHPKSPWYRRLLNWLKNPMGPELSEDSLEDVEIEIPEIGLPNEMLWDGGTLIPWKKVGTVKLTGVAINPDESLKPFHLMKHSGSCSNFNALDPFGQYKGVEECGCNKVKEDGE